MARESEREKGRAKRERESREQIERKGGDAPPEAANSQNTASVNNIIMYCISSTYANSRIWF